ncbi:DTW domain-containing protein [Shewanella halifaxensis]
MQVILLTHEREASRPTNTGSIALKLFPEYCQRIMWSRVTPSELLLAKLGESDTALLFPKELPNEEAVQKTECSTECGSDYNGDLAQDSLPKTLIILDATWQEARKMLRQSPYLKTAKTFALTDTPDSQFTLRRNQVEGGLCTLECIIELFKQAGMHAEAQVLTSEFNDFCH